MHRYFIIYKSYQVLTQFSSQEGKATLSNYFHVPKDIFPVARFFKEERLLWWFAVMQPFHIAYTVIAGWLGMFGKYTWKGRVVK